MFGVKKDTLLYYDRIGLLSPSARDDRGWRLYSESDISALDAILSLRDLGVPIDSVREAMAAPGARGFLEVLGKREAALEAKIAELRTGKAVISGLLSLSRTAGAEADGLVRFAEEKPRDAVVMEVEGEPGAKTPDALWTWALDEVWRRAGSGKVITLGSVVESLSSPLRCIAVWASTPLKGGWRTPGGLCARMVAAGPYSCLPKAYESFAQQIEDNNFEVSGPVTEEYVVSPSVTDDPGEYLTVLRCPVRAR